MRRNFIILFFLFFSMLIVLTSCSNSKTIEHKTYEISYKQDMNGFSEIINTYEKYRDVVSLNNIDTEYNSSYFDSKALVAIYIEESSKGNESEIKNYSLFNKTLVIDVKTTSYGNTDDVKLTLMLMEIDYDILNKFNKIQINKDNVNITLVKSIDTTFEFYSNPSLQYEGLVKVIRSFDEFNKINTQSEFPIFDDDSINENYFLLNSVILFVFNYKSNGDGMIIDTKVVDNCLDINVSSNKPVQYNRNFIGLIKIDNHILDSLDNIKLLKDDIDITCNKELVNFKYLKFNDIYEEEYNGNYRIVNSYEELLTHTYLDSIIETYKDFDFDNKSLVLFRTSNSSNVIHSEMWYELDGNTLNFYSNVIESSDTTSVGYYILGVEVPKEVINQTNSVIFNKYTYDHFNQIISNEYNNLHLGYYEYVSFETTFESDKYMIIDNFEDFVLEVGESYVSNYFPDYFEKGSTLIYFYECPKSYLTAISSYKVEGDTLYIDLIYLELSFDLHYSTNRFVMFELSKDILDNINSVKLVLTEFVSDKVY